MVNEEGRAFAQQVVSGWDDDALALNARRDAAFQRVQLAQSLDDIPEQEDEDTLAAIGLAAGTLDATDADAADWIRQKRRKVEKMAPAGDETVRTRALRLRYDALEPLRLAQEMQRVERADCSRLDVVMDCIRGPALEAAPGFDVHAPEACLYGAHGPTATNKRDREFIKLANDSDLMEYLRTDGSSGGVYLQDRLFLHAPSSGPAPKPRAGGAALARRHSAPESLTERFGGGGDEAGEACAFSRWQIVLTAATAGGGPQPRDSVIVTGPDPANPVQLFYAKPPVQFVGAVCAQWYKSSLGSEAFTVAEPLRVGWAGFNRNGLKDGTDMTMVMSGTSLR